LKIRIITVHSMVTAPEWDPLASHSQLFDDYAYFRDRCPVARSSAFGGYWMLSRYEDVAAAALHPATFASGVPFVENTTTSGLEAIPISLNPPLHTSYRRLLNPFFRASRISAMEPGVRALARDQLAPFLAGRGGDLVSAVSYPFPARVLCRFLGMPDDQWLVLKSLSESSSTSRGHREAAAEHSRRLVAFIDDVLRERREAPRSPQEDLLTAVLAANVAGRPVSRQTVILMIKQLFTAGHTTTSRAIANAVYFLAADPGIQSDLRQHPDRISAAIEEVLRLAPPLHQLARTVVSDTTIRGRHLQRGDRVVLNYASANRDSAEFEYPEQLVPDRRPNRHLTFGTGIHACLGGPLARLEIRVMIEEILAATRSVRLSGEPVPEAPRAGHFTSGFSCLPVDLLLAEEAPIGIDSGG
jgi:cytochrome P450